MRLRCQALLLPEFRGRSRLVDHLRLVLLLLLHLRQVLLGHVHTGIGQRRSADSSEYNRHHVRRHTALDRFSKHVLLDAPLLQTKLLLSCLLLLLATFVLFRLGAEPVTHRVFRAMPLRRRSGHWADIRGERLMLNSSWIR